MKCICNICDCGGHRCPVHDRNIARATKFQGVSEAQAEYVRKEAVQPARAIKRQERHVQGGKFYSDTEARAQYVEHVVVPPAKREAIPYRPSAIKFQGQSENHAQYTEKEARAERVKVMRAQDNLRVRSMQLGNTTRPFRLGLVSPLPHPPLHALVVSWLCRLAKAASRI